MWSVSLVSEGVISEHISRSIKDGLQASAAIMNPSFIFNIEVPSAPKDGGSILVRNVCSQLQIHTELQPIRSISMGHFLLIFLFSLHFHLKNSFFTGNFTYIFFQVSGVKKFF